MSLLPTSRMLFRSCFCVALMTSLVVTSVLPGQAEAQQGESRIDYFRSMSTMEYDGELIQTRTFSTAALRSERRVVGTTATYEMSADAAVRVGYREDTVGFTYGPVVISRNTETQEVAVATPGFALPTRVINTTVAQVGRGPRSSGTWTETVNLGLGRLFPQQLVLSFAVQELNAPDMDEGTLLIGIEAEPTTYRLAEPGAPEETIDARYKGVLVYAPTTDRLYQAASVFEAEYAGETVRLESTILLSDATGESPLVRLVDVNPFLELADDSIELRNEGTVPLWVVQSLRAYDIVNLASMTAAERASNYIPVATEFWSALKGIELAAPAGVTVRPPRGRLYRHAEVLCASTAELHPLVAG